MSRQIQGDGAKVRCENGAVNVTGTFTINGTASGAVTVSDAAYNATTWNGSTSVPTQNAVRDKIVAMFVGLATINVGTGTPSGGAVGDLWLDTN